jgi:hypothetical protein
MSNQPKKWRHKESGRIVRVMPWWEIVDPIMGDEQYSPETIAMGQNQTDGRKFKIGALGQIGWLLENSGGVWLGVSFRRGRSGWNKKE